jgi:hypothetical protein
MKQTDMFHTQAYMLRAEPRESPPHCRLPFIYNMAPKNCKPHPKPQSVIHSCQLKSKSLSSRWCYVHQNRNVEGSIVPHYSITTPTSLAYVYSAKCHKMNANPSPGGIHQNSGYFRYILLHGYQRFAATCCFPF